MTASHDGPERLGTLDKQLRVVEEEIGQILAMVAGTAPRRLRPEAALGRLGELYLQADELRQMKDGSAYQAPKGQDPSAALRLAEAGLSTLSRDDPLYPKLLHVMAMALRAMPAAPDGSLGKDGRAALADRDAWLLSVDSVPLEALAFASQWGDWAWEREFWHEAAEAYEGAGIALNRIVMRATTGILARIELLTAHGYLSPRCAFAYARLDDAEKAVSVLERAGDLLSAFGSQRRDLDRLDAIGRSDLRMQLAAAHRDAITAHATAERDEYGRYPESVLAAQARVNDLVGQIRDVPGMERFSTPAGWPEVRDAAQHLAVVYLAPTDKGVVILAVSKGAERIATNYHPSSEQNIVAAARDFMRAEYETGPSGPSDALLSALDGLGGIVAAALVALGTREPLLLIPFGILARLPLHAARSVLPATGDEPERVRFWLHPAQVRYAGSARSWLACQERSLSDRGTGALVVNNPGPLPPVMDELQLSDFERDVVVGHFAVTELVGTGATDQAILRALPGAAIGHLSCHGTIDSRMGYTGVLCVADQHLLTILHWQDVPQLSARLVFLSACSSGMSAPGVVQLISVPTMLLTIGAAAVIATFWHTDEMATLLVVTKFYALWQGGEELGTALGMALEWVCNSTAVTLRKAVPAAALAKPAASRLSSARDDDRPFNHPWFWAPFFLAGT